MDLLQLYYNYFKIVLVLVIQMKISIILYLVRMRTYTHTYKSLLFQTCVKMCELRLIRAYFISVTFGLLYIDDGIFQVIIGYYLKR